MMSPKKFNLLSGEKSKNTESTDEKAYVFSMRKEARELQDSNFDETALGDSRG